MLNHWKGIEDSDIQPVTEVALVEEFIRQEEMDDDNKEVQKFTEDEASEVNTIPKKKY